MTNRRWMVVLRIRKVCTQEASSSSNRPFSGANWLLVSGRVTLKNPNSSKHLSRIFLGVPIISPPKKYLIGIIPFLEQNCVLRVMGNINHWTFLNQMYQQYIQPLTIGITETENGFLEPKGPMRFVSVIGSTLEAHLLRICRLMPRATGHQQKSLQFCVHLHDVVLGKTFLTSDMSLAAPEGCDGLINGYLWLPWHRKKECSKDQC